MLSNCDKFVFSDVPPWLKSSGDYDEGRPSINSRRKPERRVPITAPPTKPSFETTTTMALRERLRPETPFPEVSAAPVFYENHHGSGLESETSRDVTSASATTTTASREFDFSSTPSIENQISSQEMVNEMENTFDRDGARNNDSSRAFCGSRRSRGILWIEISVGGVARRPCPTGSENGQAVWECISGRDTQAIWKNNWPDLSGN
jgi:hypothetical protein